MVMDLLVNSKVSKKKGKIIRDSVSSCFSSASWFLPPLSSICSILTENKCDKQYDKKEGGARKTQWHSNDLLKMCDSI